MIWELDDCLSRFSDSSVLRRPQRWTEVPRRRRTVLVCVYCVVVLSLYLYISGTYTTNSISIELRAISYDAGGVADGEAKTPDI